MSWTIRYSDEFEAWVATLEDEEQLALVAAIDMLEERGPVLGRPFVDRIQQSRHQNMKELRVPGNIRVLFAFDPLRAAMLLIGGNKTGKWNRWYDKHVPIADEIFDRHLADIKRTTQRRE